MDVTAPDLIAAESLSIPLDFLNELSTAVTLDDMFRSMSVWLPRILPFDRFSIAMPDDANMLRVVAVGGQEKSYTERSQPIDGTRIGEAFRTRKSLVAQELTGGADTSIPLIDHARLGFGSTAIIPLISGDECIGTLNCACFGAHGFPPQAVGALEKLASWVATRLSHFRAIQLQKASEARFNTLIERADTIIFAKSADGQILIANDKFCRVYGLDPANVIGRLDSELFGDDLAAGWREGDRRVLSSMTGETLEEDRLHADGTVRRHITQKFPMFDPVRGEYIVCAISTDISELARIKAALAESEQRFHAFFNNSPAMMYMKDADSTIVFANNKFSEFHRLAADNTFAVKADSYVPADLLANFKAHDRKIFETGTVRNIETTIVSAAGEERDFLVTKFPVRNAEGKTAWIGGINTDVTEMREREEQLRISKEEAETSARMFEQAADRARLASQAKSDFLASMSHEIRTPLNGVLGMANLLLDSALDEEQRRKINTIRSSGGTLLTILNDILDLSKIEAGDFELEERNFSLASLVTDFENMWKSQAEAKGLTWECRVETPIAPVLYTDSARIRQVLFNLASNALKFTESGSIRLVVRQTRDPGGQVENRFEVIDTGPGIAPGKETELFEKFTQADPTISRRYGGTGLGLAICKSLVELMGGKIGFDSRPGHGTCFRFSIVCPEGAAEPDVDEAEAPDTTGLDTTPLRILVVEDNNVNQQVIELMLQRGGHRCDLAANGLEALAAIHRAPYDLVLMDIQMPEMDGITATRRIRDLPPPLGNIPIIALTANAMRGDSDRYLAAGMNDYVPKPIDPATLATAIARLTSVSAALSPAVRTAPAAAPDIATGELDALFDTFDLSD